MARFSFDGIDAVIRDMDRLQMRTGPTADKMIQAGSKIMAEERRKEAERRGLRDTGDMIKKMKPARKIYTVMGAKKRDIYSQGKDEKGTRNAQKEFHDHYGYKKRPASHWVDTAESRGEKPANQAMVDIWTDFVNGEK
jgi:hypothetical protein